MSEDKIQESIRQADLEVAERRFRAADILLAAGDVYIWGTPVEDKDYPGYYPVSIHLGEADATKAKNEFLKKNDGGPWPWKLYLYTGR